MTDKFVTIKTKKNNSNSIFSKFHVLDWFGNTSNFQIKDSDRYQTKVGSFFSIIWLSLIVSSYVFYFRKFNYRNDPNVGYNKFIVESYPEVDLIKEDIHFFWIVKTRGTGENVDWNSFWSSFTLNAALHTYGDEES